VKSFKKMSGVLVALGASVCVWALLGCGDELAPRGSPPARDEAEQILTKALDAWKNDRVKSLGEQEPPIRFVDQDQAAGAKLEGYEIGANMKAVGPVIDFPVTIRIRDRRGKASEVATMYQVTMAPNVAVLRNDP
jgi:hypothetical protein